MKKMAWNLSDAKNEELDKENCINMWELYVINGLNIATDGKVSLSDQLKIIKVIDCMKNSDVRDKLDLEDAEFELIEKSLKAGCSGNNYRITAQINGFIEDSRIEKKERTEGK